MVAPFGRTSLNSNATTPRRFGDTTRRDVYSRNTIKNPLTKSVDPHDEQHVAHGAKATIWSERILRHTTSDKQLIEMT